jgi:serine/threonine protein kinase
MQHSQDRSGEQVGDYRLLRRLGAGSFGEVYLAEERRAHRHVALKLLKTPLTGRDDFKAFLNEVRSFRLTHPGIVPLLDIGMSEQDLPFLVMEYVADGTLRDRYPKGSKVPLDVVVDLTSQLASALQYAHDQHLVHRDVKPENMLCRADGTVLLSDFGIASVVPATSSVSVYQGVGGTPPYMSPEQLQGKPRRESDQYALAVVVYEWLVGARPFQGTAPEVISQHLHTPPPSLLDQMPTLPAEVEQVVFKALSKQPQERFTRVDDFAAALQAASQPIAAPSSTETTTVPTPSPLLSSSLPESAPSPLSPSSPTAAATPGWNASASTRPTQLAQEPEASFSSSTSSPTPSAPPSNERDTIPPSTSSVEFPSALSSQRVSSPTRQRRRFGGRVIFLAILTALLIGSGSLVYINVRQNQMTTIANATGISRAQANVISTARANGIATAQAQANATATAQASIPGRIWHIQDSGTAVNLYDVAWSGSQFVAVGDPGTILTSPDGRTWTPQHSYTEQRLLGVAWSRSRFVAVGDPGTILTSP